MLVVKKNKISHRNCCTARPTYYLAMKFDAEYSLFEYSIDE